LITKKGNWTVPETPARMRLDKFLALLMPGESRSRIQAWIKTGRLLVNGSPSKSSYIARAGDLISLEAPQPIEGLPEPEAIPLDIVYEDEDIAVVDKPAGLVCHAGAGVRSGTLVNAILFRMGPLDSADPMRPGIVHRLDKDTSGLVVIAKNPGAHRSLSDQFKKREVSKEYLALVHGCPKPSAGVIDLPLGRDARNRRKISTRTRRKRAAVTRYEVAACYRTMSLLRVKPETGRTHQIRVHLAQKGFPVVGDALYGGNRDRTLPPAPRKLIEGLRRHFLHAHRLEFRHPRSGERIAFVSPLPRELQDLLSGLAPDK